MKVILNLFLLFTILAANAQEDIKFGKLSVSEYAVDSCSFYPEADAMILSEKGVLKFTYSTAKGWQYKLDVTRRIKIFNNEGKEQGNISITTYDPSKGTSREFIGNLKGYTYNMVNGKLEKERLKNSEKFETRISDYRVETSLAMPNVQAGSVIEYKYSITSDFVRSLSTWHFQHDIPTAYSEIMFTIPEFFKYNISQEGTVINLAREQNMLTETFTYRKTSTPGAGGAMETGSSTTESISDNQRMVATNVYPVTDEPYMTNKSNIPARLKFQLMAIQMPNSIDKVVSGSYDAFNKEILSWGSFGERLSHGNFSKEYVSGLSSDSELIKSIKIFNWLRSHFEWNEVYGFTSSDAGRKAFNNKTGSVADINLSLVAAFREAGLRSFPVILSSRGSGLPHPIYPNNEDFNYTIASVIIDNMIYLCDATSGLPFGQLPVRSLNGKGWLAKEEGGMWVELKANAKHVSNFIMQVTLEDTGLKTSVLAKYDAHAAYKEEREFKKDPTAYKKKLEDSFPEWQVSGFVSSDTSSLFEVRFEMEREMNDIDIVYFQPILMGGIMQNIFKREVRVSPVDFPYSLQSNVMVSIQIPEGYVPELPDPIILKLPKDGGKFLYQANQIGNTINVMYSFDLQQLEFSPAEYPAIKQFYQIVSDQTNEMIVLKKT